MSVVGPSMFESRSGSRTILPAFADHTGEELQFVNSRLQRDWQRQQGNIDFGHQSALQGDQLRQKNYEAQLGLAGQLAGYRNQMGIARIQADASTTPAYLQQDRFNTVFPWIKGIIGQGGWGGQGGYHGGGQVGQQPWISDAPVYTPEQIQQQANATRAQTDAAVAGQQRQLASQMAGKGFGSRSPLAMRMSQAIGMKGLSAATDAEQQLRLGAAEKNAQQILQSQQAREQQFASRQQEEIDRGKTWSSYLSSILGPLTGLV